MFNPWEHSQERKEYWGNLEERDRQCEILNRLSAGGRGRLLGEARCVCQALGMENVDMGLKNDIWLGG